MASSTKERKAIAPLLKEESLQELKESSKAGFSVSTVMEESSIEGTFLQHLLLKYEEQVLYRSIGFLIDLIDFLSQVHTMHLASGFCFSVFFVCSLFVFCPWFRSSQISHSLVK